MDRCWLSKKKSTHLKKNRKSMSLYHQKSIKKCRKRFKIKVVRNKMAVKLSMQILRLYVSQISLINNWLYGQKLLMLYQAMKSYPLRQSLKNLLKNNHLYSLNLFLITKLVRIMVNYLNQSMKCLKWNKPSLKLSHKFIKKMLQMKFWLRWRQWDPPIRKNIYRNQMKRMKLSQLMSLWLSTKVKIRDILYQPFLNRDRIQILP